jgi:homoserine kinase
MVDVIIEPVRSILIPEFKAVKQAAISNGALGCSISGSGPSMFALSRGLENAQNAGKAMQEKFAAAGIESGLHVSAINQGGAFILND